jgi:hypothetical protein
MDNVTLILVWMLALRRANRIFILEPMVNAAHARQAVGRVYRIGQVREVTVTRFVVSDTVEEMMLKFNLNKLRTGQVCDVNGRCRLSCVCVHVYIYLSLPFFSVHFMHPYVHTCALSPTNPLQESYESLANVQGEGGDDPSSGRGLFGRPKKDANAGASANWVTELVCMSA